LHAVAANVDRILHDTFRSAANGDASFGVRGIAVSLANSPRESSFAHVLPLTSGRRQRISTARLSYSDATSCGIFRSDILMGDYRCSGAAACELLRGYFSSLI
jgi:hypothetical protein